MHDVLADLTAEQEDLDRLVAGLSDSEWDLPTPAEGWSIRDQISHLAFFDEQAALAARDPDAFADQINAALGEDGFVAGDLMAGHLARGRGLVPKQLLEWWRTARSDFVEVMSGVDAEARLPWYGPPMRAASSVVARLMETWAHGEDVAGALSVDRLPTDRLFHVAELGVKTFRFTFANRGLEVPEERVRVALRGPTGTVRVWNDGSDNSITGPLEEFCLVVAQRLHPSDTHLVVEGDVARRWLEIAQVFAGPPGPGRPARGLV